MMSLECENTLKIPHFPTSHQALVFRLWEMVSAKRIASVIQTSEENVCRAASEMGLGEQKNLDEWMSRGYISILKQVWNLLPYEQIFKLLDIDEERLSYILKEDDYLGSKLGKKCECEHVLYRELSETEKKQTEKIRKTVCESVRNYESEERTAPFEFFNKKYESIITPKIKEVNVTSDWAIKCRPSCKGCEAFVEDFLRFAKSFGVSFSEVGEKYIELDICIVSGDEEYHEIDISEEKISIRAAAPAGILRALMFLENLAESAGTLSFDIKSYKRKAKIKSRIIYSFCGLYGDVLDKDTEISFPDKLLQSYARCGINGVWIQGVLYRIAPYPFDAVLCKGWEKRIDALRKLTERAARFGIKVYMYINEPRGLPESFFEKRPELRGSELVGGYPCLCSSHSEVHKYLREALSSVCENVPLLGGFIAITQTENRTLCYSDGTDVSGDVMCPVCGKRQPSEVIGDILKTMADAVYKANPDISFFYYSWSLENTIGKEQAEKTIAHLPGNVKVLEVSETGIPFEIGGVKDEIIDYSLSIIGPGEGAKRIWKYAKNNGLETAAKVQINNSWEASTAPFIPVYENIVNHMERLIDEGVEHLMLSWTLGGYVSDNIKIAAAYFFEDEENDADAYSEVLKENYGKYADKVKSAVGYFCRAFSNYPFNWKHIYMGPANAGAANLLYPEPSGMRATMTGFPFDDVASWCGSPASTIACGGKGVLYTVDVLQKQYEKLVAEWEYGLSVIEAVPECEFSDMAKYCYTLFKASYNQISFYIERDGKCDKNRMRELVKSERVLAETAYRIMLRNSSVGYEAANHYYVTRSMLMEKIVQCDYLLDEIFLK